MGLSRTGCFQLPSRLRAGAAAEAFADDLGADSAWVGAPVLPGLAVLYLGVSTVGMADDARFYDAVVSRGVGRDLGMTDLTAIHP